MFSIFYVISLIHVHVLNKSSANLNRHYNSFFMGKNLNSGKAREVAIGKQEADVGTLRDRLYTVTPIQMQKAKLYVIHVCRKRKTVIFVGV